MDGKKGKEAMVVDPRHVTCSRNMYRYPELAERVTMEKIPDHFIFSVESVVANNPDDLVSMAWDVLIEKCDYFISSQEIIILLFTDNTQLLTMSLMPNSGPQPVIALLDMDCFYVQVEA